jgi:hypothetical protein
MYLETSATEPTSTRGQIPKQVQHKLLRNFRVCEEQHQEKQRLRGSEFITAVQMKIPVIGT